MIRLLLIPPTLVLYVVFFLVAVVVNLAVVLYVEIDRFIDAVWRLISGEDI